MKYKLHQIHLTSSEVDLINSTGDHNSVEKQKFKLNMSANENAGEVAKQAWDKGFYTHVSNITATDLENVFEVGNIGPEESIERIAPMYSVSVGDIVEDENGTMSVVASQGFKDVA